MNDPSKCSWNSHRHTHTHTQTHSPGILTLAHTHILTALNFGKTLVLTPLLVFFSDQLHMHTNTNKIPSSGLSGYHSHPLHTPFCLIKPFRNALKQKHSCLYINYTHTHTVSSSFTHSFVHFSSLLAITVKLLCLSEDLVQI